MSQVALIPLLAWVAALTCWGIALARGPRPLQRSFVLDRALRYVFIFPLGLLGLWAFVGHVMFPVRAAEAIGWPPSPFQFEVGYANLGIGLASFYAAFTTFYARVAVAIAAACFLVGAGIGHVHDIMAYDNLTPGNAGPILVTGFLTPVAVLTLLIASSRRAKPQPRSPDADALDAEIEVARGAMRTYREALDRFVKG
jgi:Na+/melibiose symporter-like transporter